MDIDRNVRHGRFTIAGTLRPEEAANLATSALSAAGAKSLETVVLDLKQVKLTRRMSVTEAHNVGERLARAGAKLLKVAFVTDRECADPYSFVLTVAVNRGLTVATFLDESQALGWLKAA